MVAAVVLEAVDVIDKLRSDLPERPLTFSEYAFGWIHLSLSWSLMGTVNNVDDLHNTSHRYVTMFQAFHYVVRGYCITTNVVLLYYPASLDIRV